MMKGTRHKAGEWQDCEEMDLIGFPPFELRIARIRQEGSAWTLCLN